MPTLKKQAEQCNNAFSIVVNNAGQYVAKFTEKHVITNKVHTTNHIHEEDKWKYMGEKEDNTNRDYYTQEDSENSVMEIRCWDCDVERPLDVSIDEDFKKECIEKMGIFKKRKEEKAIKVGGNFKDIPARPTKWYQPNLFGDDWDYDEQSSRSTTLMTDSLFELSFKSDYFCASSCYQDILSDALSPTFLQCFIDAWLEYYNPDANELQEVIDKFNLRTRGNCEYPRTKDAMLTCLCDIQQEYIESEYNDERNIQGYSGQPYKAS